MSTKTEIAQLALIRIGSNAALTNVDTDTSAEAETIRMAYVIDRDALLRDFQWPFASTYANLTLADGTQAAPVNGDWTYAYRYPADAVYLRRIVTINGRSETARRRFSLGRDPAVLAAAAWSAVTADVEGDLVVSGGLYYQAILAGTNHVPPNATYWVQVNSRLIYTNEEDAQVEYTSAITDPAEFDPLMVSALAWKLAASIAPALSRVAGIATMCLQMYEVDLSKAEARALNESQPNDPPEAEWIRSR
jgi:hypothetical protein